MVHTHKPKHVLSNDCQYVGAQDGRAGRTSKTGSPEADEEGASGEEDGTEDMDEDGDEDGEEEEEEETRGRPKRATSRAAASRAKKGHIAPVLGACYVFAGLVQPLLASNSWLS